MSLEPRRHARGYATSAAQSPYRRVYSPGRAISSSCVPCSTIRPCSRTTIRSASRIVERRWAMMNAVRPASSRRSAALDPPLGADVDRRGRLVEDEDARIGEQRARERDELPLAEREPDAALAELASRSRPRARAMKSSRADGLRGGHDLARGSRRAGRTRCSRATVPAKRKPSCGTMPSWRRSDSCVTSRRSMPSIVIRPSRGS